MRVDDDGERHARGRAVGGLLARSIGEAIVGIPEQVHRSQEEEDRGTLRAERDFQCPIGLEGREGEELSVVDGASRGRG